MNSTPHYSRALKALVVAIVASGIPHLRAATDTWIGGNGNWSVAGNWSPGLPGSADTAVVNQSGHPTLNTNAGTIVSISLGTTAVSDSGMLTISAGGSLTTSGPAILTNSNYSTASVLQSGGTFHVMDYLLMGRFTSSRSAYYYLDGGVLDVDSNILLGNQGNGFIYQTGGTLTADSLKIGSNNPGTGGNTALVQISGGGLSTASTLTIGNAGANAGTTVAELAIQGAAAQITLGDGLTITHNAKSAATLSYRFDENGVSKITMTGGAAALGGTLSVRPMGGLALTTSSSFRLLSFPAATSVTGWFSTIPDTTLWTTPGAMVSSGGGLVLDVALNAAGSKGGIAFAGETLASQSFGAAARGYATLSSLKPGEVFYVYLNVNAGTNTAALIQYFNDHGLVAMASDISAYDLRVEFTPAASSAYLVWDLAEFSGSASVEGLALLAATKTWTGASGNWSAAGNWGAGIVPGATDHVVVANGAVVGVDAGAGSVASLRIGADEAASSGVLLVQPGASLATASLDVGSADGLSSPILGYVYQSGGDFSVTGGPVYVGRHAGSRASFELSGGAFTSAGLDIGGDPADASWGQGTFTLCGGALSLSNANLFVATGSAMEIWSGTLGGASSLTLGGTLRIQGSKAGRLDFGGTVTMGGILDVQVDDGGVSKLNATAATVTLGGSLTAGFKGGVALTPTTNVQILEAAGFTNTPSAFTSSPAAAMWSVQILSNINGTRDALALSYQASASRGSLTYQGAALNLATGAAYGYATVGGLRPGQPAYVYLNVNPGARTAPQLVSFMQKYGVRATGSDLAGYNVRITSVPTSATAYLAWDLSSFDAGATVLAATAVMVPAQGAENFVINSGFEHGLSGWTWQSVGTESTGTLGATPHWEAASASLSYSGGAVSGHYGAFTQMVVGLTASNTYYAYVWCKGTGVASGAATLAVGAAQQTLPAGTYGWTCVELSFTATSASMPLAIQVSNATLALEIDDVVLTSSRMRNVVTDLGIANDGVTDVTSALATALAGNSFLYFPAGTYRTTGALLLPLNRRLWGAGSAAAINNQATDIFTALGTSTVLLGNVEVSGLRFQGLAGKRAVYMTRSANVLVRNCTAEVCTLLRTLGWSTNYGSFTSEADLSRNFRVAYNVCTNPAGTQAGSYAGIALGYITDAEASHNYVSYMNHGICWWGGNSDMDVNGAPTNPRWARRLYIADNEVRNLTNGGIWGSMGDFVLVERNVIAVAGDVALDYEGCYNSVGQYNTVSDGKNGCLAIFVETTVEFRNNTVFASQPTTTYLYRTAGPSTAAQSVALDGNLFYSTVGQRAVRMNNANSALKATNNVMSDSRIFVKANNGGTLAPTIRDNVLSFISDYGNDSDTGETNPVAAAIKTYNLLGLADVRGNVVAYRAPNASGKVGIFVFRPNGGGNGATSANVSDNVVTGFGGEDIRIYQEPSLQISMQATANGNIVANAIKVGASGKLTLVQAVGNTDFAGEPVSVVWIP